MLARVSHIETFRRWRADEDATTADLVARLTSFQPTERMDAGTAFHKALELALPGDYDRMEAMGHTFLFEADASIYLPSVRELRCFGDYGRLKVTGQVDALEGKRVEDQKTTAYLNAESYLDGCQWKFYLDIFGADVFRWNVFEIKPVRGQERTYTVGAPHTLEQYRYPALHDDCLALAADYYDFASRHLQPEEIAA